MDITGIAKSRHADIPKASSKKEWKLSDSLREKIAGYAREDAAQGVYMGNKFLALRKARSPRSPRTGQASSAFRQIGESGSRESFVNGGGTTGGSWMDNFSKHIVRFNAFQIKIIALITMTLDHIGAYQTFTFSREINDGLRVVGRIAAPLFLFMVVEGLRYTRSNQSIYCGCI